MRAGTPALPVWVPAFAGMTGGGRGDDSSVPGRSGGYFQRNDKEQTILSFRAQRSGERNLGPMPCVPMEKQPG